MDTAAIDLMAAIVMPIQAVSQPEDIDHVEATTLIITRGRRGPKYKPLKNMQPTLKL